MLTIIRWERGSTVISFFASYTGWILVRHRWHCLRFLRVLSLVSVFVSVAVVQQKNVRTSWLKLNLEHSSVSQNNQGFFYWFNSRLNSTSMIGAASDWDYRMIFWHSKRDASFDWLVDDAYCSVRCASSKDAPSRFFPCFSVTWSIPLLAIVG